MIAKGVRFNSRKYTIGNYFQTEIYEFSMMCKHCFNKIKIRTDPEKCDYKLIEGCVKYVSFK